MDMLELCKIKPHTSRIQNSLWHWDAYPHLPDLAPHSRIELAHVMGTGVIKTIHLTLNIEGESRQELLRQVYLQVRYEGHDYPSVSAPVGDFFCDSFNSQSSHFASLLMAKRPTNSLFCYIPMPFQQQAHVSLLNTTDKLVTGYGYVTAETFPAWNTDFGYFHANWTDKTSYLPDDTLLLLDTKGKGHFLGCHLTAVSACRHFTENLGICEGNDEFYIDGAEAPYDYLGTEDFFGFSWNWRKLWYDNYAGTTYLNDDDGITKLACYRFLLNDPVRFSNSLRFQINYQNEVNNDNLQQAKEDGSGKVDFNVVSYWYQHEPVDVEVVETAQADNNSG